MIFPVMSVPARSKAYTRKSPTAASKQEIQKSITSLYEDQCEAGEHRDMSPPRVLRWSYDALAEEEKRKQSNGTFSPLANALRPEFKYPPGLDHPDLDGSYEIASGFAGLQSGVSAAAKP